MSAIEITTLTVEGTTVFPDEFVFGSWNDVPLSWRVLKLEEGRATVMSVRGVESRAFHEAQEPTSWEGSSLRGWMNGEFLAGAFAPEWREAIVAQSLENSANADYATEGGNDTSDQLFCLSYDEICTLIPADARRALEGDGGLWWLRTPGGTPEFAAYVHNNGWVNTYGYNVDEAHVCVRPAMVLDVASLLEAAAAEAVAVAEAEGEPVPEVAPVNADDLVRASEYGEELLLEAMETEDLSSLTGYIEAFGVDESWASFVVETVESAAAEGDGAALEGLFDLFGTVEYLSGALAIAIGSGHSTAAAALIRHGARLDGKCLDARLTNDTPELKKARKMAYGADRPHYSDALDGEGAGHAIRLLMNQEKLKPADYRGLLYASAAREDRHDLYEWLLCPDRQVIPEVKARWSGKRVSIVRGSMHRDVPVSAEGLRHLWCEQLCQDDPETVRNMAPFLGFRDLDNKGALLNLLAREGWNRELSVLLGIYRMFSINQLAEGVRVAKANNRRDTAEMLLSLLRSVGAGKLAAELEA